MRKVAIVGGGPRWKAAPFDDPEREIWVLGNQLDRYLEAKVRVDRVFEIHEDLSEHGNPERYVDWLFSTAHEIDALLVVGDIPVRPLPAAVMPKWNRFDKVQSRRLLPGHLTSSPAYMMSQALQEDVDEISIWGIDMAVDDHEYFMQRPAMYAWIGYALGKDIPVYIDPESPLFKDPYDEGRDWGKVSLEYPVSEVGSKFARPPFTERGFLEMAELHEKEMGPHLKILSRPRGLTQEQWDIHLAKFHSHSGAQQAYDRMSKVARAVEAGQPITNLTDSFVTK